jgi:polysaccharide export outer membrane protein
MSIRTFIVILAAVFAATLGGAIAAQAQQPATPAANPPLDAVAPQPDNGVSESASGGYILGRDDVVAISLVGRTDFNVRQRVQVDGSIQLPMIGKVEAADQTTAQLSETIRKKLQTGGYFADPIVGVEVVSFASRYVTVLGAVTTPGLVPLNRTYRLSEILARVGGVKDSAADYVIVRPEKGPEKQYAIRDLATGDVTQDPYVAPGDKIYSPLADTFYVYGSVNSPGRYVLASDMTVRMALARAGGLTPSGSDNRVEVTRGGKKVKLELGAKLAAGDVLFVGERLF